MEWQSRLADEGCTFRCKAVPLPDNCCACIFEDVTDAKRAEKRRKDGEQKIQGILDKAVGIQRHVTTSSDRYFDGRFTFRNGLVVDEYLVHISWLIYHRNADEKFVFIFGLGEQTISSRTIWCTERVVCWHCRISRYIIKWKYWYDVDRNVHNSIIWYKRLRKCWFFKINHYFKPNSHRVLTRSDTPNVQKKNSNRP